MAKNELPGPISEILREKDLAKASLIFDVPIDYLRKMNEQGMLDVSRIKCTVIRQDFLNYRKIIKKRYSETHDDAEIIQALMKEYNMPLQQVRDIAYKNTNHLGIFCRSCGKRISNLQAKRSGGLCPTCNSESLPKL